MNKSLIVVLALVCVFLSCTVLGQANEEIILASSTVIEEQPLIAVEPAALPVSVDYSSDVTFVGDQDGTGTCCLFSNMHLLEILKEHEWRYTPDPSFRFMNYVYQTQIGYIYPPDPRVTPGGAGQPGVLRDYGLCLETSLPTNYNNPNLLFSEPIPSDANFVEAASYKIQTFAEFTPTLDNAKQFLYMYGPIGTNGLFSGHCVLIIGYNDTTQTFRILDSAGGASHTPEGLYDISYAYFNQRAATGQFWTSWHQNKPTGLVHPYTARVNITQPEGRKYLTVKIGVEGLDPLTIWDRNNVNGSMIDSLTNLKIDVKLPDYAASHWPPSAQNQWYVDITDSSPGPSVATINEITLVRRSLTSSGAKMYFLSRPSKSSFTTPNGGTTRIYVPTKQTETLSLATDRSWGDADHPVKFSGNLLHKFTLSSTDPPRYTPYAGQTVYVWQVTVVPIEGIVQKYLIGTTTTDGNGHYEVTYAPDKSSLYAAYASRSDYSFIAMSNLRFVGAPGTWSSPGGHTLSSVAIDIEPSTGREFAVLRGTDNHIYASVIPDWGGWAPLGGTTYDEPAVAFTKNYFHIVIRGTDNQLYYKKCDLNSGVWDSAWTLLGGHTLSAPTLISETGGYGGPDNAVLAIRGTDNHVYLKHHLYSGLWSSGWDSWVAGTTYDRPSLAFSAHSPSDSYDHLTIGIRGSDNKVYTKSLNTICYSSGGDYSCTSGMGSWIPIGMSTASPPLIFYREGILHTVVRGTDNHMYLKKGSNPYTSIGGTTYDMPAVYSWPDQSQIDISVRGSDSKIYNNILRTDLNQWTGWIDMKKSAASHPTFSSGTVTNGVLAVRGTDNGVSIHAV